MVNGQDPGPAHDGMEKSASNSRHRERILWSITNISIAAPLIGKQRRHSISNESEPLRHLQQNPYRSSWQSIDIEIAQATRGTMNIDIRGRYRDACRSRRIGGDGLSHACVRRRDDRCGATRRRPRTDLEGDTRRPTSVYARVQRGRLAQPLLGARVAGASKRGGRSDHSKEILGDERRLCAKLCHFVACHRRDFGAAPGCRPRYRPRFGRWGKKRSGMPRRALNSLE
jgi:hypothetical protein